MRKSAGGKKSGNGARRLPAALAKRASAAAALARKRLIERARADIELIQRRKEEIVESFYDIGEALVRLQKRGTAAALGYPGFYEMCRAEVGLAATQVDELVRIVRSASRKEAIGMGQSVAGAMARLAAATPDPHDTPGQIFRDGVTTPSGKVIKKGASARAIESAAKEFRQKKSTGRGRTTTPEERAIARHIEARLHAHGIRTAKVEAVASQPGRESNLRVLGVPLSKRHVLAKALNDA
jgi:hypothetical protein